MFLNKNRFVYNLLVGYRLCCRLLGLGFVSCLFTFVYFAIHALLQKSGVNCNAYQDIPTVPVKYLPNDFLSDYDRCVGLVVFLHTGGSVLMLDGALLKGQIRCFGHIPQVAGLPNGTRQPLQSRPRANMLGLCRERPSGVRDLPLINNRVPSVLFKTEHTNQFSILLLKAANHTNWWAFH